MEVLGDGAVTWVARAPRTPLAVPTLAIPGDWFDHEPDGKSYGPELIRGGSYGLGVMRWPASPVAAPAHLHDLDVAGIHADPPRSSNGTAEAGLWVGNNAIVERCRIRDCAWMGIWTGAACSWLRLSDARVDVSMNPHAVGIYVEHETDDAHFQRCRVVADGNAFSVEWWYDGHGSRHLVVEDGYFESRNGWCFYLDAGTYGCTLRRLTLAGLNGIAHPAHLADPSQPNTIDWDTIDATRLTGQRELVHENPIGAAA